MTLPILLSVPHAGLAIPPEVAGNVALTAEEIAADGDVGAARIYDLGEHVGAWVRARVARAFVDLNRDIGDRRADGVVKTHTCWNVPVYRAPLAEAVIGSLLDRYHRPYHTMLTNLAATGLFRVGLDCHTMAAEGPPIGPDPGRERPFACLGVAEGTCPRAWVTALVQCLEEVFDQTITVNDPFAGGFVTRAHAEEMPWIQLELSRTAELADEAKRDGLLRALSQWVRSLGWIS